MAEGGDREGNSDEFDDFESEFQGCEDPSDGYNSDRSVNQTQNKPCRFYNAGSCRDGKKCAFLHVCRYYFTGNCKYDAKCKFTHDSNETSTTSDSDNDDGKNEKNETRDTNYQWQIRGNNKWLNINHDWLIEAQYSQPGVVGIKIFNTTFGAISIDFKRMKVRGKDLKVRRLSGKDDCWLWYCRCDSHWNVYGNKDSRGNYSNINSTTLEGQYQMNPKAPYNFTVNNNQYQIDFTDMKQTNITTKARRSVRRRPQFMGIKADSARGAGDNSNLSKKPIWKFCGNNGAWHSFKQRGKLDSVSSDQLESSYQQNPQGSITYSIGKFQYQLDFAAMNQTNVTTGKVRKVQRV